MFGNNKLLEVQIGTYSLHKHKAFKNGPMIEVKGTMENSTWCFNHALALPLYNDLTLEQQELVVNELKACL